MTFRSPNLLFLMLVVGYRL